MNAVEKLQAAQQWIERKDKHRAYRAPETLTDSEKWSIGVWSSVYDLMTSTIKSVVAREYAEAHVGLEPFTIQDQQERDVLALADAILVGDR